MIKVFEDFDISLVGYYKSILEANGIETFLKNQFGTSGAGELPFVEVIPQIWVLDEGDVDQARALIVELKNPDNIVKPSQWDCPECGEPQEPAFTNCWKCSATRPGLGNKL